MSEHEEGPSEARHWLLVLRNLGGFLLVIIVAGALLSWLS